MATLWPARQLANDCLDHICEARSTRVWPERTAEERRQRRHADALCRSHHLLGKAVLAHRAGGESQVEGLASLLAPAPSYDVRRVLASRFAAQQRISIVSVCRLSRMRTLPYSVTVNCRSLLLRCSSASVNLTLASIDHLCPRAVPSESRTTVADRYVGTPPV